MGHIVETAPGKIVDTGYFNPTNIFTNYFTNIKATSNAMEVMLSAKELSMGMTKLSGSKPFWKVKIEMAKDTTIIAATAMTFTISKIETRFKKADNVNMPFMPKDKNAKRTNIIVELAQVLTMCAE
jgi:hypothetical protein